MEIMRKIKLGLDFDGVLTQWPPIIGFLASTLNSTQTPKFLYGPFCYLITKLPIFLNFKRLENLKKERLNFKFYLITGRKGSESLIKELMLKYGYFDLFSEIIAQKPTNKLTTEDFKLKISKRIEIKWYFDDNRFTVFYLRKKGIKAIKV